MTQGCVSLLCTAMQGHVRGCIGYAHVLKILAHKLVHQTFDEATVGRLSCRGYAIHAKSDCALERHPK